MNKGLNQIYIYTTTVSLLAHLSFLSAVDGGFILPTVFKPKVKPRPDFVALELVDEKRGGEVKKKPESNLIDELNRQSRDRELSHLKGLMPKLEGVGKVKRIHELLPSSKQLPAEAKQKVMEKYDQQIEEIRKKIQELAVLEKKLAKPLPEESKEKPETTQTTQVLSEAKKKEILYKKLVSEAREVGELSLATQKHSLAPYLKKMKDKIFEKWYPFVSLKLVDLNPSKTTVEYKVLPNGEIRDLKITYHEGSVFFRDFCETAVRVAAPFDPLPVELPDYLREKYLSISFTFYYD